MRILYYSPHPNLNYSDPAGYGTHMREMVGAFRERGHEVELLIMGGTEARRGDNSGSKTGILNLLKKIIPGKWWQKLRDQRLLRYDRMARNTLEARIRAFQPDLIYERANYLQASGVRAAHKLRIPHILEMNSPYTEEKSELDGESGLRARADKIEGEQLHLSDHIVPVSSALRDYLAQKHQIATQKFTVIPNAINPDQLHIDRERVAKLREELAVQDKVVVGWIGSIQPWHGISTMIDAFAGMPERDRANMRLLIVGGGETLHAMQARAAAGPARKQIIFTGKVDHRDVFPYLELMDVCLLPDTKWYCSPIKIFEYGAMGKAIVAANHASVRDVMEPDLDGLVIEPEVEILRDALVKLGPKPELRARFGQQFKDKVLREHTWQANARRVVDIANRIRK